MFLIGSDFILDLHVQHPKFKHTLVATYVFDRLDLGVTVRLAVRYQRCQSQIPDSMSLDPIGSALVAFELRTRVSNISGMGAYNWSFATQIFNVCFPDASCRRVRVYCVKTGRSE